MRDRRWISWVLVAFGLLVVMYEVVTFLQEARPESLAICARWLGWSLIAGGLLFGAVIVLAYLLILLAAHFSEPMTKDDIDVLRRSLDEHQKGN